MAEGFLRMTRKWLEGEAVLRQETLTQSFTKSTGKRTDELISTSSFHEMKCAVMARLSEGRSPEFRSHKHINPWNSNRFRFCVACSIYIAIFF